VSALQDQVEGQLEAAYDMIKVEKVGGYSRKDMARMVLQLLPSYIETDVIERNRGRFAKQGRTLGRLNYIRAAALWMTGQKDAAHEAYKAAVKLYGSCDEKEMCDGIGLNR
jgi:hypothetical protein